MSSIVCTRKFLTVCFCSVFEIQLDFARCFCTDLVDPPGGNSTVGFPPKNLPGVHNCQKSKEEIHTLSAKKTRTKNIIFSWRNLILKIFEKIFFLNFFFEISIFGKFENILMQNIFKFSRKSKSQKIFFARKIFFRKFSKSNFSTKK